MTILQTTIRRILTLINLYLKYNDNLPTQNYCQKWIKKTLQKNNVKNDANIINNTSVAIKNFFWYFWLKNLIGKLFRLANCCVGGLSFNFEFKNLGEFGELSYLDCMLRLILMLMLLLLLLLSKRWHFEISRTFYLKQK